MQTVFREIKSQIIFQQRTNPNFPAHVHDNIELVYTKKGRGTAYCDGKKYTLVDGTWFLAFPNQVHHYADCTDGEYWVLIMKPFDLLRYGQIFMKGVPDSAVCHFKNGQDDGLGFLLETACREYVRDGYGDVIAAYLTVIFGKLLPFFSVKKVEFSRETVLRILQYCTAHYKEDLTVTSVAESLDLSRSCVSHIFSTRISMNFCDYINSLRLAEAVSILNNKNYTVTEVASMSGFSTIRTFNRAFLKKYGISPSAYRKQLSK
jgi:AraC-like DNA-binding protein